MTYNSSDWPAAPLLNTIYNCDAMELLEAMPDESINCVITSPPYWGLRDYGTATWVGGDPNCKHGTSRVKDTDNKNPERQGLARPGTDNSHCYLCGALRVDKQIGIETTLAEYLKNMVILFREVRRVLRPDGVMWLNMGDCYATSSNGRSAADTKSLGNDDRTFRDKPFSTVGNGLKNKDLVGQPWRLAFALQEDGWYLRSDCIWHKPNPMPASVKDRPTTAHEYVFLMTKSERYYFDPVPMQTKVKEHSIKRQGRAVSATHKNHEGAPGQTPHSMNRARPNTNKQDALGKRQYTGFNERYDGQPVPMAHPRTVWSIPTAGFEEDHFATFPEALIRPLIDAGCPHKVCSICGSPWVRKTRKIFVRQEDVSKERGVKNASGTKPIYGKTRWGKYQRGSNKTITKGFRSTCTCNADTRAGITYDPFMGIGTTALVARSLGRNYIGSELNPEYIDISKRRLKMPFEKVPPKKDKPIYTPAIEVKTQIGETIIIQQMELLA